MKVEVRNTIKHPMDEARDVYIVLQPTSIINAGYKSLPVIWKGTVDHHQIVIIQSGIYASIKTIEFIQFPDDEYGFLKRYIIRWLHEVLKKYS